MITAYPKIFALGTDYIKDIFDGEVEITEKVDGSQFAFGMINDILYMRSKGAEIHEGIEPKMFAAACEHVKALRCELPMNWVFYGEVLNTPKHNALAYNRVPKNHIALFGMMGWKTKEMMPHAFLTEWARKLEVDVVPKIYFGKVGGMDELNSFLSQESYLGGQVIEGVVVKNYNKPFLLGGQPIPVMAGKLVRESFKEVNRANWSGQTQANKFDQFCKSFCTEARWEKAIQHLRDNDTLTNSPKDIGALIKEVNNDIISEEAENIKRWLFNESKGTIMRAATKGLPEWYKCRLAATSFNTDRD